MDTAEITLTGNQQMPHVPPLGHAGQGWVDRVITVGVISLHRLADDAGTFAGRRTRDLNPNRASPPRYAVAMA